jgi:glycosyltransferase involved in cell wall biosynthesis
MDSIAQLRERLRIFAYDHLLRFSGGGATLRDSSLVLASSAVAAEIARKWTRGRIELVLPDGLPDAHHEQAIGPRTDNVITWVGRALPIKGLCIAVEAFSRAAEVNPGLRLQVVGEGPDLRSAREQVRQLGIESQVEFLGALPWNAVQEVLGTSTLLLFTSLRDTFGAQVLEALGNGTPVVALSHHGVGDHCPSSAVYKVPKVTSTRNAAEQLATGILSLTSDQQMRERMSVSAREWAAEQRWGVKASRLVQLYEDVLRGPA